jgi:hypothetical protein
LPTVRQLERASAMSVAGGNPFYELATEVVRLSHRRLAHRAVASALAGLLLSWNGTYYRYNPGRRASLVDDLDDLLAQHRRALAGFGRRSIASLRPADERAITRLFEAFDDLLGSVGASKALHLLAPRFFPLWDTKIARAYGIAPAQTGCNAARYLEFMEIARRQHRQLGGERAHGRELLRAIDAFNYWRYTRGRI